MHNDPLTNNDPSAEPLPPADSEAGPPLEQPEPGTEPIPSPLGSPEPVRPTERIAAVDVLRGFAVLGILAMNIVNFGWPMAGYENPHFSGGDTLPNRTAWIVNSLLFSGKMMSLFSMLFGAGLILMSDRARERGASILGVYYRRIFWLMLIGLIHAYLIWKGDILFMYALCGLLLYPVRRFPPALLIGGGTALIIIGIPILLSIFLLAGFIERIAVQVDAARAAGQTPERWQVEMHRAWHEEMAPVFRPPQEKFEQDIAAYRSDYPAIVAHRAPSVLLFHIGTFFFFMLWGGLGRMLLGMGLMKLGVFSAERSWRFYRWLALFGYGVGLPLSALGAFELLRYDYNAIHAPWGTGLILLGMVPTALGHAAIVMMICKGGLLRWLTSPLSAVGRMALTNYLMQSLIATTIFYGYGLGLFGSVDRVGLWGIVLAVWLVQLLYSPLWLKFFRYGPAEWLWRSLTYWRLEPIRHRPTAT